ncbi:Enhancer of polycomb-like N-terminal [Trinorchestia longiramus]|nr:Enhancer of polycomb-like N-terminal [Trinorchestia longiramus]
MSKFRARQLDATKPIPIYLQEDISDYTDLNNASNRTVPQMPTGMEKEEETEHHLQQAIFHHRVIPVPEVYPVESTHAKIYPPNYKQPRQLIHILPFNPEQDIPDYDMDSEDEEWLLQQAAKGELLPLDPPQFEEMMDRLEKSSGLKAVTLQEAKVLLKDDDGLITAVYDYWLNKRLKTQHTLIPQVKTEKSAGSAPSDPYVAFRKRTEKMQTRKNRKNDESSYEKMLKLKRDLTKSLTMLQMVSRREKAKRELLHLHIEIFEKRYELQDWTGSVLSEVLSSRPVSRSAFAPLVSNHLNSSALAAAAALGGAGAATAGGGAGGRSGAGWLKVSAGHHRNNLTNLSNASAAHRDKVSRKRDNAKRERKNRKPKCHSSIGSAQPHQHPGFSHPPDPYLLANAYPVSLEDEDEKAGSGGGGGRGGTSQSDDDSHSDGPFAFFRRHHCQYHAPSEDGVRVALREGGGVANRTQFSLTSLPPSYCPLSPSPPSSPLSLHTLEFPILHSPPSSPPPHLLLPSSSSFPWSQSLPSSSSSSEPSAQTSLSSSVCWTSSQQCPPLISSTSAPLEQTSNSSRLPGPSLGSRYGGPSWPVPSTTPSSLSSGPSVLPDSSSLASSVMCQPDPALLSSSLASSVMCQPDPALLSSSLASSVMCQPNPALLSSSNSRTAPIPSLLLNIKSSPDHPPPSPPPPPPPLDYPNTSNINDNSNKYNNRGSVPAPAVPRSRHITLGRRRLGRGGRIWIDRVSSACLDDTAPTAAAAVDHCAVRLSAPTRDVLARLHSATALWRPGNENVSSSLPEFRAPTVADVEVKNESDSDADDSGGRASPSDPNQVHRVVFSAEVLEGDYEGMTSDVEIIASNVFLGADSRHPVAEDDSVLLGATRLSSDDLGWVDSKACDSLLLNSQELPPVFSPDRSPSQPQPSTQHSTSFSQLLSSRFTVRDVSSSSCVSLPQSSSSCDNEVMEVESSFSDSVTPSPLPHHHHIPTLSSSNSALNHRLQSNSQQSSSNFSIANSLYSTLLNASLSNSSATTRELGVRTVAGLDDSVNVVNSGTFLANSENVWTTSSDHSSNKVKVSEGVPTSSGVNEPLTLATARPSSTSDSPALVNSVDNPNKLTSSSFAVSSSILRTSTSPAVSRTSHHQRLVSNSSHSSSLNNCNALESAHLRSNSNGSSSGSLTPAVSSRYRVLGDRSLSLSTNNSVVKNNNGNNSVSNGPVTRNNIVHSNKSSSTTTTTTTAVPVVRCAKLDQYLFRDS